MVQRNISKNIFLVVGTQKSLQYLLVSNHLQDTILAIVLKLDNGTGFTIRTMDNQCFALFRVVFTVIGVVSRICLLILIENRLLQQSVYINVRIVANYMIFCQNVKYSDIFCQASFCLSRYIYCNNI